MLHKKSIRSFRMHVPCPGICRSSGAGDAVSHQSRRMFVNTTAINQNHRINFGLRLAMAASALALLGGCSSGELSKMWRDPLFKGTVKNALVIAVRKDPVRRRMWEDGFVAELNKHRVTATPSYRLFPDALPDTASVIAAIRSNGYDGVIVTRRIAVDTVSTYVPGNTRQEFVTRYDPLRNAYFTYYHDVTDSGYTETERIARHEVSIWSTGTDGRMIWSATGDAEEQGSGESVDREIVKLIVPELVSQGIIPGQ